jgi:hypothetical protein
VKKILYYVVPRREVGAVGGTGLGQSTDEASVLIQNWE